MAKHRPIVLSAASVRAILAGEKTQLRRVIKPLPIFEDVGHWRFDGIWAIEDDGNDKYYIELLNANGEPLENYIAIGRCPYGKPGDILYAQRPWKAWKEEHTVTWRPAKAMTIAMSPVKMRVTDVEIEQWDNESWGCPFVWLVTIEPTNQENLMTEPNNIFAKMDAKAEEQGMTVEQTTEHAADIPPVRETFTGGAVRDAVDYRYDLMSPEVVKRLLYFDASAQSLAEEILNVRTVPHKTLDSRLTDLLASCLKINYSDLAHYYAQALHEGASKYGERNWEKGIPSSNLINHAIFHLFKYAHGDPSENHATHLVWNVLTLIHFDDRK